MDKHEIGDDQRENPREGHTLLLMEPKPAEKTFTDFPSRFSCLDSKYRQTEDC